MTLFITVLGVVQGVGYRPFVARLAEKLNITGSVKNSGGIVEITASGTKKAADEFIRCLQSLTPPGGQVLKVIAKPLAEQRFPDFRIVPSAPESRTGQTPIIPPDLPVCDACLKELYDKNNRRYLYPFISCVSCGPRYSIMNTLPYDRDTTTMEDFPMCPECRAEYTGKGRRRHAQTISCHDCGPQLLYSRGGEPLQREEALEQAIRDLKSGAVIGVKGIGGYQFACLPQDDAAVDRLRRLKHRDKKPFAVMFPSLASLKDCCEVSPQEEDLLSSPARPIVLLNKKKEVFCTGVSGESRFLGAFLSYTPLHQLLTDSCGPLVMTSGNLSGEPVMIRDEQMLSVKSPFLNGVLYNARRIVTPLDDSVARVMDGKPLLIRRSRGYVPLPILLERRAGKPLFAAGGDLKAGFCLYQNDRAYLSQYFGDTEHDRVFRTYEQNYNRMTEMFRIEPELAVCDLHPGYLTASFAERLGKPLIRIQHHHAHIASVMAEHALDSCIGVAFDGTGYGTDGAVWGGEFLLCRGGKFERRSHLDYVALCGGDAAAKNAAATADCYRYAAGETGGGPDFNVIRAALEHRVNMRNYSSMGRLFDAVAAELGIRKENSYEGECAIALENEAAAAKAKGIAPYPLPFPVKKGPDGLLIDQAGLFRSLLLAKRDGVPAGALALGFHAAAADMVVRTCAEIRRETGENRVALSGGVFANLLLTEDCLQKLRRENFEVFLNSAVPSNDGGICLGQAWLCSYL
jgi:hydrogenase maturation protein HypF